MVWLFTVPDGIEPLLDAMIIKGTPEMGKYVSVFLIGNVFFLSKKDISK